MMMDCSVATTLRRAACKQVEVANLPGLVNFSHLSHKKFRIFRIYRVSQSLLLTDLLCMTYLEDVLVCPVRVLRLHDERLYVVPPVEQDAQGQQRRVLVHAGVPEN